MTTIDPAEVMARHELHRASRNDDGCTSTMGTGENCLTYRLTEALAQALSELERMREPYRVQPAGGSIRPMSDPYGRTHDA